LQGELKMSKGKTRVFLAFLSLAMVIYVNYPVFADGTQELDHLPSYGEELTVTEDNVFTVAEGETVVLAGNLTVRGEGDSMPVVQIIVNGELVISGSVTCNHANVTLRNEGTLSMQNTELFNVGTGGLLYLYSDGVWTINKASLSLLGGSTYLSNYGSIAADDWTIEAQQGRIFFHNDGDAAIVEGTFSSVSPSGMFTLTNNGSLQFHQSVWNVNYGGTISFDGRAGNLLLNHSIIEGTGEVDGHQSVISMMNGNTTFIDSHLDGHDCSCIYHDSRVVNLTDSTLSGIGNYNSVGKVSLFNSTISVVNNYNNVGDFSMVNGAILGINNYANSGDVNIVNSTIADINNYTNRKTGNVTLTDCTVSALNVNLSNHGKMIFDSTSLNNRGGTTNILNVGELYSYGWTLKTEGTAAIIKLTNQGNITFIQPFIEDATGAELTSIGVDGKQFVQSSGGKIQVFNFGLIMEQAAPNENMDIFIYLLALAAMIIVVMALFLIRRNKKKASSGN
jgi:hypothetical protein